MGVQCAVGRRRRRGGCCSYLPSYPGGREVGCECLFQMLCMYVGILEVVCVTAGCFSQQRQEISGISQSQSYRSRTCVHTIPLWPAGLCMSKPRPNRGLTWFPSVPTRPCSNSSGRCLLRAISRPSQLTSQGLSAHTWREPGGWRALFAAMFVDKYIRHGTPKLLGNAAADRPRQTSRFSFPQQFKVVYQAGI